jgi:hypothetical protein
MRTPVYEIVTIDGLTTSPHRSVVFLRETQENQLNASAVFDGLAAKQVRDVRSRFDYWIAGNNVHKQFFHGWPGDSPHNGCFVFKYKEKGKHHRLYGFLCHPCKKSRPGFRVCVLCTHAAKNQWLTDPRELDGALALSTDPIVLKALSIKFQEKDK